MKMLIGSMAAKHWFEDFREPHDMDFFVSTPEENYNITDVGIPLETFYHPLLARYMEDYSFGFSSLVATPNELYTIKMSHSFWDLNNRSWDKHMHDILFYQSKECKVNENLFDVLYAVWVEVHGEKKANLNATPEEFFNKNVVRKYDHDSIHHSVAYGDVPMFEKILRDGAAVAVDKNKFDALSYEDKCRLVREEVYATALERILIPKDYRASARGAYHWALKKTITSFSKGWFPRFIVENYSDLYRPDVDYVQRHRDNANCLILLED